MFFSTHRFGAVIKKLAVIQSDPKYAFDTVWPPTKSFFQFSSVHLQTPPSSPDEGMETPQKCSARGCDAKCSSRNFPMIINARPFVGTDLPSTAPVSQSARARAKDPRGATRSKRPGCTDMPGMPRCWPRPHPANNDSRWR